MKKLILVLALNCGWMSLAHEEVMVLKVNLSEEESYQVYEYLKVPAVADPDGRRLVKETKDVFCSRTSYYPGDFEYSCTVVLRIRN